MKGGIFRVDTEALLEKDWLNIKKNQQKNSRYLLTKYEPNYKRGSILKTYNSVIIGIVERKGNILIWFKLTTLYNQRLTGPIGIVKKTKNFLI